MIKPLLTLAFVLAFLAIAALLLRRPKTPDAPFAKAVDHAEKITLQIGNNSIDFTKNNTDWWVAASSGGARFRADPEKLKTLLKSLREVRVEDVISERGETAADYEINPESATILSLYGPNNALQASGHFGKQAPDFSHLYFRFPHQAAIYLARGAIRGELGLPEVKTWLDPDLLNIPEDMIQTVSIEGPGFKTLLERSSNTWSVNGKKVDPTRVWALIGQLAHLRAEDYIDPAKAPQLSAGALTYASLSLQTQEGKSHRVRIGKKDTATQRHPVMVDEGSALAWVSENTVKMLLQKPSDFKQP